MGFSILSSLLPRIILLALISTIPSAFLIFSAAVDQKRVMSEHINQEMASLVKLMVVKHEVLINSVYDTLFLISKEIGGHWNDAEAARSIISSAINQHPYFANIGVLSPEGDLMYSAVKPAERSNFADRPYFRRALETGAFSIGELQVGRIVKKPTVNFAYPVKGDGGKLNGVAFIALSVEHMVELIKEINAPSYTAITVLDRQGKIVTRWPGQSRWVGVSTANTPLMQNVMAKRNGVETMTGVDGEPRIYSYATLSRPGYGPVFFMIAGTPEQAALAEVDRAFNRHMLYLFLATSLAMSGAWVLGKRLVINKIEKLAGAAREIAASGAMGARTGLEHGKDEIGQLALAFDEMAETLEKKAVELEKSRVEVHRAKEELERRVAERTVQLEEANKELEAFSYSVSHDLRAPLRTVDGFSLALYEDYQGKLDDAARDYLGRIRSGARRMGELIDDMLKLSRISRTQAKTGLVDLSRLALSIVENLRIANPDREVEFDVQAGMKAEGDEDLLRIALENLLGNSWKFTSNVPQARVEFKARLGEKGERLYYVRDNGAGFDMKYASRLFGVFQRLHDASEFQGTGVGLATVQRIIHKHGGRISAESEPGKGAVFYFTLRKPGEAETDVIENHISGGG
ncbi:MAG: HAMP domain-containing protein [Nitrospinae bacterium]|nr:HAMP domain-containing protein [Nitrospinota bacterium]